MEIVLKQCLISFKVGASGIIFLFSNSVEDYFPFNFYEGCKPYCLTGNNSETRDLNSDLRLLGIYVRQVCR